jgi:hypothetical protein
MILEWIKLYKVRLKPWDLSGSPVNLFDYRLDVEWGGNFVRGRGDPFPWWRSSLVDAASR